MKPLTPIISPPRRGFTLIEMLLAIVLVLALSGAVTTFVWGVIASRDRTAEAARRADEWSRLVTLIDGAVLTSCAQGSGGAFGGNGTSVLIPCRVMRLTPDATAGQGGGAALGVSFESGARAIVVTRGAEREEAMSGVGAVSIRYWDGRAWSDSFAASAAGGLPAAVELAVWLDTASEPEDSAAAPRHPPDHWRVFAIPDGRGDLLAGGDP